MKAQASGQLVENAAGVNDVALMTSTNPVKEGVNPISTPILNFVVGTSDAKKGSVRKYKKLVRRKGVSDSVEPNNEGVESFLKKRDREGDCDMEDVVGLGKKALVDSNDHGLRMTVVAEVQPRPAQ